MLLLLQLRGAAKVVMVGGYQGFPSEDLKWATFRQAYPTEDSRCGVLDLTPTGRLRATEYFNGRQYCTPLAGAGYLAATAQPSYYLGGVASLLMIAGTVWALVWRRRLIPLLLLPWAWVASYAFASPIDRYAIPIWPYKVMFGALILFGSASWLLARVRSSEDKQSDRDPPNRADLGSRPAGETGNDDGLR